MKPMRTHNRSKPQRGAAFLVMLVVLIMGVTFYLVSALNKVTMQTARNEKSADILAQAKEVVIGDILHHTGSARPGEMMFPDVLSNTANEPNYDGVSEGGCFDSTASANYPSPYTPLITASNPLNLPKLRCLGRLPWKSLGMSIGGGSPSENDPTGFMPWYAFSRNLVNPNQPINSELLNTAASPWLKVYDMKGNLLSDRVAFVIIIPGPALPNQSRPPSPNLKGPDQYLDQVSLPPGCTASCTTYKNYDLSETFVTGDEHRWMDDPANPGKQIEDPTYQFNDKLLYVTIDELIPLLEKRIVHEVKSCLDSYAATSSQKYPWAAPVSDLTYATTPATLFGRIPATPVYTTTTPLGSSTDPNITALLNALDNLQTAETNCQFNDNLQTALTNAGNALLSAVGNITNPPFSSTFISKAKAAGNAAISSNACDAIQNHPTTNSVQTNLNAANSELSGMVITTQEDASMLSSWPAGCFVTGSYWDDWKNLVFYQVDSKYRPNGTTASCGGTCLSITGSGNTNIGSGDYRATVTVAGKMVSAQSRTTAADIKNRSNYLEGANTTGKTDVPTTFNFETYRTSDSSYQTITNDLVLCLDGKNNCK